MTTCRCGGEVVAVKMLGHRGWRKDQCVACGRVVGLPYTLRARKAVEKQRQRMQRAAEYALAGQTPRPRGVDFNQPSRSGWTPDLALPKGDRE